MSDDALEKGDELVVVGDDTGVVLCSVVGNDGMFSGRSVGSASGIGDDWRKSGRAVSSCWSCASISGVGLSESGDPRGGGSVPVGSEAVGSSSWGGLFMVEWLRLSIVIGPERSRWRHVHASLVVEQEKACGARR